MMKLAIAQMVLGALSVSSYIASVVSTPAVAADEVYRLIFFPGFIAVDEGYRLIFFPWFNVYLALGLAVLGCGIAQFLKARKVRTRYATP